MANKTRYNDATLQIKLPADLKAKLEEAAAEETMTVSLFVRKLILDHLKSK